MEVSLVYSAMSSPQHVSVSCQLAKPNQTTSTDTWLMLGCGVSGLLGGWRECGHNGMCVITRTNIPSLNMWYPGGASIQAVYTCSSYNYSFQGQHMHVLLTCMQKEREGGSGGGVESCVGMDNDSNGLFLCSCQESQVSIKC